MGKNEKLIKIESLFNSLKKQGLITPGRKIQRAKIFPDFKASFFKKTIYYPPKVKLIHKNRGAFILLHEEAHCNNFSYQKLMVLVVLLIGLLTGAVFYLLENSLFPLWTILSVVVTIYLFIPFARKEEYLCDRIATKVMITRLKISPSRAFRQIFFSRKKRKLSLAEKLISIIYFLFPYHPPAEDRLKSIIQIEQKSK